MSLTEPQPQPQPPLSTLNDILVYINSSQATLKTPDLHSSIHIQLPRMIHAEDGYSLKASLHSMTIANTHPAVNEYNNQLTISGTTQVITPGNYSATTLAAAIQVAFPTRSVSFNSLTSKMTFSSSSTMSISGSMCSILNIDEWTSGLTITSKNNVDLSCVQTIYVYTNLSTSAIDTTSSRKRGLLAAVQNAVAPLGILHYSDTLGTQGSIIDTRSIFDLSLTLYDDNGNALLAYLPFQAVLKFSQIPTGVRNLKLQRPGGLTAPPLN